jgi:hypothetical protein
VADSLRLRLNQLEWREVDGEVVALDLRTSRYLAVNRSGARLWNTLAAGATRDQLSTLLVETYGLPRTQAEDETDAFLEMLAGEDLLEGS